MSQQAKATMSPIKPW